MFKNKATLSLAFADLFNQQDFAVRSKGKSKASPFYSFLRFLLSCFTFHTATTETQSKRAYEILLTSPKISSPEIPPGLRNLSNLGGKPHNAVSRAEEQKCPCQLP